MDATKRRAAIESIGQQLQAHYVDAETAQRVASTLQKKLARGEYDALADAGEFADTVWRDLLRLARDKHMGLHFGPMPSPPDLKGKAPPGVARSNHGFGVSQRLRGNVALLVINGFPPPFDEQKAAIGERMSELTDADALIVDLRNNGGGFPPTEVLVASYFFDDEPLLLKSIYRRDEDSTREIWTERELSGKRFGSRKPVYILTGRRTFSGGEALAYELQAHGRAVVVGEGTGGGAHPAWPYPVQGGFVLRVPFGRSIHPLTGTNWEGIGVVPDVDAPEEQALEAAHRLALQKLGRE
jgi:retinol-binding protein 3